MMDRVYHQLAIDYNCAPEDFLKDGLIFTEAKKNEGRRPFPWNTPRLEMITMGRGVVVNASADILPAIRRQMKGKTSYEALTMPFVFGVNPYFLPALEKSVPIPHNEAFEYERIEKPEISSLYPLKKFPNALQYNPRSQRPEMVAMAAKHKGEIVAIATASADCAALWQIGVDVLPPYRNNRLATILVSELTREVLDRGVIPYYSTDCSNVASQRIAVQSGYVPAWSHCFKARLDQFTPDAKIPPLQTLFRHFKKSSS